MRDDEEQQFSVRQPLKGKKPNLRIITDFRDYDSMGIRVGFRPLGGRQSGFSDFYHSDEPVLKKSPPLPSFTRKEKLGLGIVLGSTFAENFFKVAILEALGVFSHLSLGGQLGITVVLMLNDAALESYEMLEFVEAEPMHGHVQQAQVYQTQIISRLQQLAKQLPSLKWQQQSELVRKQADLIVTDLTRAIQHAEWATTFLEQARIRHGEKKTRHERAQATLVDAIPKREAWYNKNRSGLTDAEESKHNKAITYLNNAVTDHGKKITFHGETAIARFAEIETQLSRVKNIFQHIQTGLLTSPLMFTTPSEITTLQTQLAATQRDVDSALTSLASYHDKCTHPTLWCRGRLAMLLPAAAGAYLFGNELYEAVKTRSVPLAIIAAIFGGGCAFMQHIVAEGGIIDKFLHSPLFYQDSHYQKPRLKGEKYKEEPDTPCWQVVLLTTLINAAVFAGASAYITPIFKDGLSVSRDNVFSTLAVERKDPLSVLLAGTFTMFYLAAQVCLFGHDFKDMFYEKTRKLWPLMTAPMNLAHRLLFWGIVLYSATLALAKSAVAYYLVKEGFNQLLSLSDENKATKAMGILFAIPTFLQGVITHGTRLLYLVAHHTRIDFGEDCRSTLKAIVKEEETEPMTECLVLNPCREGFTVGNLFIGEMLALVMAALKIGYGAICNPKDEWGEAGNIANTVASYLPGTLFFLLLKGGITYYLAQRPVESEEAQLVADADEEASGRVSPSGRWSPRGGNHQAPLPDAQPPQNKWDYVKEFGGYGVLIWVLGIAGQYSLQRLFELGSDNTDIVHYNSEAAGGMFHGISAVLILGIGLYYCGNNKKDNSNSFFCCWRKKVTNDPLQNNAAGDPSPSSQGRAISLLPTSEGHRSSKRFFSSCW